MCIKCGELSEYGPDLLLRPTSADHLACADILHIQRMRKAWAYAKECVAKERKVNPPAKPA